VGRVFVVGGVLALVAAAVPAFAIAPMTAPAAGTADTWTVPGCVIGLANSFVPARRHVAAHWHTDGTATCTGAELDAEARVDLTRNRVAITDSFARDTCNLPALKPCTTLHASHDTPYHGPRADWRPRLVLFVRGPLSLPAATSDYCVVDVPSFETICTFVGAVTRR
jgi:hypothetical protein